MSVHRYEDLSRLTIPELFDELEYRLDEDGCRFLAMLRGHVGTLERELEQAREAVPSVLAALQDAQAVAKGRRG